MIILKKLSDDLYDYNETLKYEIVKFHCIQDFFTRMCISSVRRSIVRPAYPTKKRNRAEVL